MEPMFFFYLTLGAMLFLVISMLLGHDDDIGHGHTGGHAGGHGHSFGHGHGHGFQHGHAGHAGHTHGHGAHSDNMSIWSFQMLFLFTGGFGVGGYFASLYRLSAPITISCGVLGGVVLASIGYFIINIFYRRQGDSNVYSEEYIGLTGIVVTSINGGGVGQVRCAVGAQRETFLAKSVDGNTIPINSLVLGQIQNLTVYDSPLSGNGDGSVSRMLKLGPDVLFQSFQALKNTGMMPLIVGILEKSGIDISTVPGLNEATNGKEAPSSTQTALESSVATVKGASDVK